MWDWVVSCCLTTVVMITWACQQLFSFSRCCVNRSRMSSVCNCFCSFFNFFAFYIFVFLLNITLRKMKLLVKIVTRYRFYLRIRHSRLKRKIWSLFKQNRRNMTRSVLIQADTPQSKLGAKLLSSHLSCSRYFVFVLTEWDEPCSISVSAKLSPVLL